MKLTLKSFLFLVLALVGSQFTSAQRAAPDTRGTSGIATLYARDPLTQSLCLRDGGPGGAFQDGKSKNRCSDLNFNTYVANAFSVGVEGGREGVIIDLGTPEDLISKYRYEETLDRGQGFTSIDVRNGKSWILKNYRTGELQELAQSASLFQNPTRTTSSAAVETGHIYLMRITDRTDKSFEMFAKVLVLTYAPNESVTVRWYLMANDAVAKF